MDLTAQALDIEELVAAFADAGGTELAQMKELWRARSFSFIHDARPKDVTPAFYAQGLFSAALGHVAAGAGPLPRRLGGLYALYALHGTQPPDACFLIYLSLEELEALHALVREAGRGGPAMATAVRVVRRMVAEHAFLFGSVSANQRRIAASVARLARRAGARVQQARLRLLTDAPVEQHLRGDLDLELGLHCLPEMSEQYAEARARALSGGCERPERPEATLGAALMDDAVGWDAHKAELLERMQRQADELRSAAAAADFMGGSAGKSRGGKCHQKTITEYERELRERDSDRELAEQLDQVLDE